MNKQEVYNRVKAALLEQGCRSFGNNKYNVSFCMYRSPNGKKCAVGHLILDEHYSEDLEGKGCGSPDVITALRLSGIDYTSLNEDANFLRKLQSAHDDVSDINFVTDFTENMARIAKDYHLEE